MLLALCKGVEKTFIPRKIDKAFQKKLGLENFILYFVFHPSIFLQCFEQAKGPVFS